MSPYLITGLGAGILGIALGAAGMHYTIDSAQLAGAHEALASEKAAHARDNEQAVVNLKAVSDAAAQASAAAIAKQTSMQQANDSAQATIAKLQGEKNAADQKYRSALAAGTERVRVAVRSCQADSPASGSAVSGNPQSAGGSNDASTFADLDPTVAERVFGVAADDQREIDKLVKLQAWACTVKADAPGCGPTK